MPGGPSARLFLGSGKWPTDGHDPIVHLAYTRGPAFSFTISNPHDLKKKDHQLHFKPEET